MEVPDSDFKTIINLLVENAGYTAGDSSPCKRWYERHMPLIEKYSHFTDPDNIQELHYLRREFEQLYYERYKK